MKNATKRRLGIVLTLAGIAIFLSMIGIQFYMYAGDNLRKIQYICTTGEKPWGLRFYTYENKTHTIDMQSCMWIKNEDYPNIYMKSQDLNSLSCDELQNELDSGKLYRNDNDMLYGKYKFSLCDYVDRIEKSSVFVGG